MRIGIVRQGGAVRPGASHPSFADVTDLAREIERLGFAGLWTTDGIARGRPVTDPLTILAAAAAATQRIELGTCILQVPLRAAVDLAIRAQTVAVMSGGRLRFGVGPGSTKADFDLAGADFEARFRTTYAAVETMRQVWRGEPQNGVPLVNWPDAPPPPLLLGGWRSPRTIGRAAREYEGWIASGAHGTWEDAEAGIRDYRAVGGRRAILANVPVDLRENPERTGFAAHAHISLVCPPSQARERLDRIRQLGFDDLLIIPPNGAPDQLEQIRGLIDRA